ncbi:MAG: selenium metabolism-associated LysR family transcriptional regulator [Pseudomonadota bacterium]|jgi:DNA-binding transcriptional LysR family regulator
MSYDLKQLRAFEAVARHGSFTRASEEIGLTQPTLSTHIRNLESGLGVRLFDRASRKVNLTPTGMLLQEYAKRILAIYDQSLNAVEAYTGRISGSIDVDASTVPGEYILPGKLVEFHRRYPQVRINLTVSDSAGVLNRIEKGETSIGVIGRPASHPAFKSSLLCSDSIVLVSVPGALTPGLEGLDGAQLKKTPLIRREKGSATQLAVESGFREIRIDPDTVNWAASLGSTRAVIEGVIAGLGAAFVSRIAVLREISNGTLEEVAVRNLDIERGLYVVRHDQRTLSPAASCFLDELLKGGPDEK